jgi:hypothetical protein
MRRHFRDVHGQSKNTSTNLKPGEIGRKGASTVLGWVIHRNKAIGKSRTRGCSPVFRLAPRMRRYHITPVASDASGSKGGRASLVCRTNSLQGHIAEANKIEQTIQGRYNALTALDAN